MADTILSREQVEAIRARADDATPGPWTEEKPTAGHGNSEFSSGIIVAAVAPRQGIYADPPGGSYPAADRTFIAASRTDVPALSATCIHYMDATERLAIGELRDAAERVATTNLFELDNAYQAEKQRRRSAEAEAHLRAGVPEGWREVDGVLRDGGTGIVERTTTSLRAGTRITPAMKKAGAEVLHTAGVHGAYDIAHEVLARAFATAPQPPPAKCFECDTPLIGPLCPKCNPLTGKKLVEALRWAEGWFARVSDGEEGVNYLNGDSDKYPGDGWTDMEVALNTLRHARAAVEQEG